MQAFDSLLKGKWVMDSISPVNGKTMKQLYKIQKPYLNFVDANRVAGNNGCNNVSGGYKASGEEIQFDTENFKSTRMFCQGVNEELFLDILNSVNRYQLKEEGTKLILLSGDKVHASFLKLSNP